MGFAKLGNIAVLTGRPLKPEIPISTADTVSAAAPCAKLRLLHSLRTGYYQA